MYILLINLIIHMNSIVIIICNNLYCYYNTIHQLIINELIHTNLFLKVLNHQLTNLINYY